MTRINLLNVATKLSAARRRAKTAAAAWFAVYDGALTGAMAQTALDRAYALTDANDALRAAYLRATRER